MKFNFSKEWCERMARLEDGHEIGAGVLAKDQFSDVEICPICRNYDLERSWCGHCNKTGIVIANQQPTGQE